MARFVPSAVLGALTGLIAVVLVWLSLTPAPAPEPGPREAPVVFADVAALETSSLAPGDLPPGAFVSAGPHRYRTVRAKGDLTAGDGLALEVLPVLGQKDVTAYAAQSDTADAMFARALARPGSYVVPPGDYPVSRALVLQPGTHLHLAAGARIRLIDGAVDNLIRNANATAPLEPAVARDTTLTYGDHPPGTEVVLGAHRFVTIAAGSRVTDLVTAGGVELIPALDRDIRITGSGALSRLDGNGTANRKEAEIERWRWIGLLFENIRGLEVRDIAVADTARWGMACQSGCYEARFQELYFDQPGFRGGAGIPNQDCINLRSGTSEVYVGHIFGQCGDDAVALTAIHPDWRPGMAPPSKKPAQINMNVAYRARDIGYVTIEHVETDAIGSHHKVRLLGSDRNAVHHVFISDLHDTTRGTEVMGNEYGRSSATAAVLIGSARYGGSPHADETLMHNIHIDNVSTLTRAAVRFQWSSSDVYMSNLTTQWSAATDSPDGQGQEAFAVFYDYEDAWPPPKGLRAVHRRHVLNGAALLHDGDDVTRAGDLRDGGVAVGFDKTLTVTDSSYSDVFIKQARHAVVVGPGVTLKGVHFEDFRIVRLGQMAFRVMPDPDLRQLDWSASSFTLLDRAQLWPGHRNAGYFYSARNTLRLGDGMPAVQPGEPVPAPVPGSRLRFAAGAGGFDAPTSARAENGRWVPE